MSANGHKQPGKMQASPEEIRGVLRELRDETPADDREFTAQLHRRLVAAGAPPSATWLGRLAESARDLWQDLRGDRPQKRTLLTGALLGALVTAVAFSWLAGARFNHEALRDQAAQRGGAAEARSSSHLDRKSRTAGDRRLMRDRMGADIGAERPERAHVHVKR